MLRRVLKMKEKKVLTPTQQRKKYKRLSRLCFGGEFVSIFAPFITIAIINFNEYFYIYDGWKIGLGGFLALAVMGIAVWLVSKQKFSASFVSLVIGWGIFTFIFYLLTEILNQITTIMFFGWIGLLGAYGLDIAKAKLETKAEKVQQGIEKAQQEMVADAYKEEIKQENNKKVRF